eukprot:3595950-Amphidinium_carterae.1
MAYQDHVVVVASFPTQTSYCKPKKRKVSCHQPHQKTWKRQVVALSKNGAGLLKIGSDFEDAGLGVGGGRRRWLGGSASGLQFRCLRTCHPSALCQPRAP